ncbi:hypothetical protein A9K55_002168 [Cordyceps militaris]|uniref:Uncharacterized protein n=1 Tax=Cordyceps militaris TaxID=73501 RepID=A0A2H4SQH3_CORMI|nr:hypothetical protein A9K55_002168 [Cordyceps militaris]
MSTDTDILVVFFFVFFFSFFKRFAYLGRTVLIALGVLVATGTELPLNGGQSCWDSGCPVDDTDVGHVFPRGLRARGCTKTAENDRWCVFGAQVRCKPPSLPQPPLRQLGAGSWGTTLPQSLLFCAPKTVTTSSHHDRWRQARNKHNEKGRMAHTTKPYCGVTPAPPSLSAPSAQAFNAQDNCHS